MFCFSFQVSTDMSMLDVDMPFCFSFVVSGTFELLGILIVIAVITWEILIFAIPMLYIVQKLQVICASQSTYHIFKRAFCLKGDKIMQQYFVFVLILYIGSCHSSRFVVTFIWPPKVLCYEFLFHFYASNNSFHLGFVCIVEQQIICVHVYMYACRYMCVYACTYVTSCVP